MQYSKCEVSHAKSQKSFQCYNMLSNGDRLRSYKRSKVFVWSMGNRLGEGKGERWERGR